jgi:A/G-specific adenine glycosylase
VLRLWEGLGYYRRARQLHAAAQVIVAEHAGAFPTSFEAVRALPGIGRYTAGAILSIGTDARLPILEANTIRVLSRLTAFRGDPASSAGQKYLWSVAETILPDERVGLFNQALMELGSEVCTPKSPGCDTCPVARLCEAKRLKLVGSIPRPAKRTQYEDVTQCAVVILHRGRVLLRQCQPGERWAGLWDFPRFAISPADVENSVSQIVHGTHELIGLRIAAPKPLATLKHGVTRFRITLHCFEARLQLPQRASAAKGNHDALHWVAPHELTDYPLSVTGRKIALRIAPATTTPQKSPTSAARRRGSRRAEG